MNKEFIKKNSMIIGMTLFVVIVYIIGLIIVNNKISWTLGMAFGYIFAVLKLKLMENALNKAVQMPEAKAQKYANAQYMIRYILTGVVLVVAALEPGISLPGVFAGLFSMKAGAYMQLFVSKTDSQQKAEN